MALTLVNKRAEGAHLDAHQAIGAATGVGK
jgi:hypothetical protein